MRLSYERFRSVAERAEREVRKDYPDCADVNVVTMSAEAMFSGATSPAWGEFRLPSGPIVLYQMAYEGMPDQQNYYRQLKAVLRHEFEHARGSRHDHLSGERWREPAIQRGGIPGWVGREPYTFRRGDIEITLP